MKGSFIVCFTLIVIQSVYCPPPIKTSTQSSATTTLDTANPATTTKIETASIETTTLTTPISNGAGGGTVTPLQSTIASSSTTSSLSSIFLYFNKSSSKIINKMTRVFLKVAIVDSYGMMKVYDGTSMTLIKSFQAHTTHITRIKQLPNGYAATCSFDVTVKIWNATGWNLILTYRNHTDAVVCLEYISPNTIASGDYSGNIQIWSMITGLTQTSINAGYGMASLKLLSNGFYLASGSSNGNINIYNINNGLLIATLYGQTSSIADMVLVGSESGSSSIMASSSDDSTIYIWDLTTITPKFILRGHTSGVYGLKMITSNILASSSIDSTIKLWNTTSGALIRTLTGHTDQILWSVDLLNPQTLVSASYDRTIKFWDWTTGQCLNTITSDLNAYSMVVFNSTLQSKLKLNFEKL
jgi:WD40 repeat protein